MSEQATGLKKGPMISAKMKRSSRLNRFKLNYDMYLLLIPSLLFILVFHYLPLYGITIAFKDYNMFAGKGDYAFALRSREESKVDFHIYAGGSWRSILFDDMPAEMKANWQNHEHQVVGIYDAENNKIQLYVDGTMLAEQATYN